MSEHAGARTLVSANTEPEFSFPGTSLKFITSPDDIQRDLCLLEGGIPAGGMVPLHKHRDPEIFYLLSGELEFYVGAANPGWRTARAGDAINIPGDTKHAFRNATDRAVRALIVSGRELYSFFREVVSPRPPEEAITVPSQEQIRRMLEVSARYENWVATPEENAAIGLVLPVPGADVP